MTTLLQRTVRAVFVDGSTPIRYSPTIQVLHVPVGSDCTIEATVINSAGAAVDLTGAACILSIKQYPDDPAPLIARLGTVQGPYTGGIVDFELSGNDTIAIGQGTFIYDVTVQFADGDVAQVVPVSNFVVDPSAFSPTVMPTIQLPSQTGQDGKVLGTDGTNLDWVSNAGVPPGGLTVSNPLAFPSTSGTVSLTSGGEIVDTTSADLTRTLPVSSLLASGQSFPFLNVGNHVLTVAAGAGDSIMGGGVFAVPKNTVLWLTLDVPSKTWILTGYASLNGGLTLANGLNVGVSSAGNLVKDTGGETYDTTSSGFTRNLPVHTGMVAGQTYAFKNETGTHNVTLAPAGGDTIDGNANYVLVPGASVLLTYCSTGLISILGNNPTSNSMIGVLQVKRIDIDSSATEVDILGSVLAPGANEIQLVDAVISKTGTSSDPADTIYIGVGSSPPGGSSGLMRDAAGDPIQLNIADKAVARPGGNEPTNCLLAADEYLVVVPTKGTDPACTVYVYFYVVS